MAASKTQILDSGDRFVNQIIKIHHYPLHFPGSLVYVNIVKEINKFLIGRYRISLPNDNLKEKANLKTHIKNIVAKCSTYVLIDKVKNSEYFIGTKRDDMDPDEKCARIVSVMVMEKNIFLGPHKKSSSLIHYLCTYPSMHDRGYASKILRLVFDPDVLCNKVVYAVTKLPYCFIATYGKMRIDSDDVKNPLKMKNVLKLTLHDSSGVFKRFKFTRFKNIHGDIVDECDLLIYAGSEHMRTNAVSIRSYVGTLNDSAL